MTDEQINEAVAEHCGSRLFVIRKPICEPFSYYRENACGYTNSVAEAWKVPEEVAKKYVSGPAYKNEPDKVIMEPAPAPNYANDLNAMHEAEKALTEAQWDDYEDNLRIVCEGCSYYEGAGKELIHATARQRAEAFLKTLNKWSDQ